jgi:type VI protein secretion system component VasK
MSVTRLFVVVLAAAAVAAATFALWPASEAEKAREDGEQLGQAVSQLYYAESTAEVDAALDEVHVAVTDSREHAGDAVAEQAADQEDALVRAADGFAGAVTADNEFDSELYQVELEYAVDDLTDNASQFQTEAPEVQEAYWEGVEAGFNAS